MSNATVCKDFCWKGIDYAVDDPFEASSYEVDLLEKAGFVCDTDANDFTPEYSGGKLLDDDGVVREWSDPIIVDTTADPIVFPDAPELAETCAKVLDADGNLIGTVDGDGYHPIATSSVTANEAGVGGGAGTATITQSDGTFKDNAVCGVQSNSVLDETTGLIKTTNNDESTSFTCEKQYKGLQYDAVAGTYTEIFVDQEGVLSNGQVVAITRSAPSADGQTLTVTDGITGAVHTVPCLEQDQVLAAFEVVPDTDDDGVTTYTWNYIIHDIDGNVVNTIAGPKVDVPDFVNKAGVKLTGPITPMLIADFIDGNSANDDKQLVIAADGSCKLIPLSKSVSILDCEGNDIESDAKIFTEDQGHAPVHTIGTEAHLAGVELSCAPELPSCIIEGMVTHDTVRGLTWKIINGVWACVGGIDCPTTGSGFFGLSLNGTAGNEFVVSNTAADNVLSDLTVTVVNDDCVCWDVEVYSHVHLRGGMLPKNRFIAVPISSVTGVAGGVTTGCVIAVIYTDAYGSASTLPQVYSDTSSGKCTFKLEAGATMTYQIVVTAALVASWAPWIEGSGNSISHNSIIEYTTNRNFKRS